MDASAYIKYIRVSPRKLELLARRMSDMSPQQAIDKLTFMPQSGALELKKVIASALANAKNKNLSPDLKFREIVVLPGGGMKRFRAVSRGMAHEYKKRMSHIKVVLEERVKAKEKPAVVAKPEEQKVPNVKVATGVKNKK